MRTRKFIPDGGDTLLDIECVKVSMVRVCTADFVVKVKGLCDWLPGLVDGSAHEVMYQNHGKKTLCKMRELFCEVPLDLMMMRYIG